MSTGPPKDVPHVTLDVTATTTAAATTERGHSHDFSHVTFDVTQTTAPTIQESTDQSLGYPTTVTNNSSSQQGIGNPNNGAFVAMVDNSGGGNLGLGGGGAPKLQQDGTRQRVCREATFIEPVEHFGGEQHLREEDDEEDEEEFPGENFDVDCGLFSNIAEVLALLATLFFIKLGRVSFDGGVWSSEELHSIFKSDHWRPTTSIRTLDLSTCVVPLEALADLFSKCSVRELYCNRIGNVNSVLSGILKDGILSQPSCLPNLNRLRCLRLSQNSSKFTRRRGARRMPLPATGSSSLAAAKAAAASIPQLGDEVVHQLDGNLLHELNLSSIAPNLHELWIDDCNIVLRDFTKFTGLRVMCLRGNTVAYRKNLEGKLLSSFLMPSPAKNLEVFDAGDITIVQQVDAEEQQAKGVEAVSTHLSPDVDLVELFQLQYCSALRHLSLNRTRARHPPVFTVPLLENLRVLELENCDMELYNPSIIHRFPLGMLPGQVKARPLHFFHQLGVSVLAKVRLRGNRLPAPGDSVHCLKDELEAAGAQCATGGRNYDDGRGLFRHFDVYIKKPSMNALQELDLSNCNVTFPFLQGLVRESCRHSSMMRSSVVPETKDKENIGYEVRTVRRLDLSDNKLDDSCAVVLKQLIDQIAPCQLSLEKLLLQNNKFSQDSNTGGYRYLVMGCRNYLEKTNRSMRAIKFVRDGLVIESTPPTADGSPLPSHNGQVDHTTLGHMDSQRGFWAPIGRWRQDMWNLKRELRPVPTEWLAPSKKLYPHPLMKHLKNKEGADAVIGPPGVVEVPGVNIGMEYPLRADPALEKGGDGGGGGGVTSNS